MLFMMKLLCLSVSKCFRSEMFYLRVQCSGSNHFITKSNCKKYLPPVVLTLTVVGT